MTWRAQKSFFAGEFKLHGSGAEAGPVDLAVPMALLMSTWSLLLARPAGGRTRCHRDHGASSAEYDHGAANIGTTTGARDGSGGACDRCARGELAHTAGVRRVRQTDVCGERPTDREDHRNRTGADRSCPAAASIRRCRHCGRPMNVKILRPGWSGSMSAIRKPRCNSGSTVELAGLVFRRLAGSGAVTQEDVRCHDSEKVSRVHNLCWELPLS